MLVPSSISGETRDDEDDHSQRSDEYSTSKPSFSKENYNEIIYEDEDEDGYSIETMEISALITRKKDKSGIVRALLLIMALIEISIVGAALGFSLPLKIPQKRIDETIQTSWISHTIKPSFYSSGANSQSPSSSKNVLHTNNEFISTTTIKPPSHSPSRIPLLNLSEFPTIIASLSPSIVQVPSSIPSSSKSRSPTVINDTTSGLDNSTSSETKMKINFSYVSVSPSITSFFSLTPKSRSRDTILSANNANNQPTSYSPTSSTIRSFTPS